MPTDRALLLLERLSALLRSELRAAAATEGLEPVHVLALWYLSRANTFSDNPLAVGEFLGLSKGNMSQRLNLLESKGFLRKVPDTNDRRRLHLSLTRSGSAALARLYPPPSWTPATNPDLESSLDAALRAMVAASGAKTFGICNTCRHHQPRATGGFCGLLEIELSARQSTQLCQEHTPD